MKKNTYLIMDCLAKAKEPMLTEDVSIATNLSGRTIAATFTMAIAKKGWGRRVESLNEKGKPAKRMELTAEGEKALETEPIED